MKKHLFLKSLLIAIGLLVTSLTTQVLGAAQYYYRGNQNSWGATKMTVSTDGFYEYFSAKGYSNNGSQNNNFKVALSEDSWDYDKDYCTRGYNGTNISGTSGNGSIGLDWDGTNICVYNTSDFYVIVYYPTTCINTTSNPIICASTTLPEEKFYVAGDDSWMAKDWTTDDDDNLMSRDGNIYSKTISSVSAGTNTHKLKVSTYNWKNSWGYSDYSAATHPNIVGSVSDDGSGNIVFKAAMEGDVTVSFNTSTKKVSIICQAPTITFDKESGSGGASTQNTYYNEATSNISTPSRTGYNFGGYHIGDDGTGTMVINASGVWQKNIANYTDNSATPKWIVRADATLHAKWTEKTYSVTVRTANSTMGTVMSSQTSTSVTAKHFTSDCAITATPEEGYRFTGWTTSSGSVVVADASAASTTIKATATGTTVTANFEALPSGQLDIVAGSNGQVKKESGSWGSSASYTDQNDDVDLNIYAKADAGYHFVNWTKSGDGSIKTNAASGIYTLPGRGSATVTANFAETTTTLTPTVSYDHGSSTYTASATNSGTIGVATTTTISCSAPNAAHYTFAGWDLTNLTVTNGDPASDRTITVKVNTPGSDIAAVAKYEEVLEQDTWILKGGTSITGDNWSEEHALTKKSGYSTSDVVYYTVEDLTALSPASGEGSTANTAYNFKIIKKGASDTWFGLSGSGDYWYYRSTGEQTMISSSSQNIQVRADVTGDYEIKVDYSDPSNPTVTITFPTSYTLTYAIGDVAGNDGDISSSPSTASGSKVLSGSEITLTGPAAKTGYTWKGWYTNAAGTEGKIADSERAIAVTMNADKTLYACYTEDSYTVTVNASSGGQVSYNGGAAGSSCTASAGIATASNTIHAIPAEGYAFVGWTGVSEEEENHITGYTATWNSTNKGWDLTVNADAATTITANFAPRFALVGSVSAGGNPVGGMPGWSAENAVAFAYSDGTYTIDRTLTAPNSTYKFKIIDRLTGGEWLWRGYTSSSNNLAVDNTTTYTLSGTNDVYFDTKGVGDYTFTVVEETVEGVVYPKVKIQDGTNSHVVTWGYVSDNGQEGGTITSVVDGEATPNNIVSGKYVKDGGSIIVTAAAVTPGYRFIDFRTSSTYGGGSQLSTSNPYTVASVEADQNIYAQFAENKCTVTIKANDKTKGSITVGGEDFAWDETTDVGVYNYKSLVVTPVDGYYFSGWTLSSTPDFAVGNTGESGASTTLRGLGGTHGSTGTLTANFVELDKIYFRNIFDDGENEPTRWANVYVYFDVDWDTYNNPSWGVWYATGKVRTQMTQIEETDVYWAYVPRAFTSGNLTHVAFSEQAFTANLNFRTGNAAFRSDYNKLLNMFVPHHTKSSTQTYTSGSSYTTNYYSNGYWMKYDTRAGQGAGYYLKKYNGTNSYSLDSVFRATNDDATFIQCRIRVDGITDGNNRYMIVSAAGLNYITDSTITSLRNTKGVSEDTRTLANNDVYFQVKATSEGFYTFILDQSGDKMKLTIDYPVSPGDYRLKHTYVGRNKANNADSTYITYSDNIKASDASSGATVSMYLSTAGTLVLQECTSINSTTKLPEWNAGESDGLSGVFTKVGTDGDGVYQFDVTVNTSTNKVTATENIALYDGPFYIKTDCAPGGWANYTRNEMDKNTINPTAFDYYFMKWLDLDTDNNEKKNIKCVIANQYNNAISDTLKSDGIATMVGGEPVLDNDGSVRFSYNSKTNALERAYLTGASNLTLETYAANKIYNKGGSTDQYGSHPGFVDDVVWTYEITVDAKLGAQAGVRANWVNKAGTDHYQTLIANTNKIIDGTGSDNKYTIRILFDFKTNSLISTWEPSSAISDKLSDVDVMLVREGQAASDVITFSGDGSLKPRKLVGSLKFTKTNYEGKVSAWNSTTRPLLMFFVSFPFDVKVNDIFGLNGAYGSAYVIRRYAGEKRAEKGFFRGDGTTSFWEDLTLDSVMHAYQGYIVVLDNDYFNSNAYGIWGDKSEQYLYFPSVTPGTIVSDETTIKVPSHECKINRTWYDSSTSQTLNHKNTDSHWSLIGVPVFTTITGNSGTVGSIANVLNGSDFHYFYEWDSEDNDFGVGTANGYSFKAMHGYMVQYHGDITFTGAVFTPSSVAARRAPVKENYNIELQVLDNDEEMVNHTYVELRENAHTDFELNEDVYLSPNNRAAEIYSFAGDYDVAANVLPRENQTVQVGLNVHKAGTYTIAMPSNFSGTATLIDTYNNTRTNLAIDDYEVTLPKGACNDRFLLDINIHKVPTAIDGVDGGSLKDGKAHKFIENDKMYILKNGTIYNAQGAKVK